MAKPTRHGPNGDFLANEVPATCTIDGCDGPNYGHDMCNKHWARWYHHGDPMIVLRQDDLCERKLTGEPYLKAGDTFGLWTVLEDATRSIDRIKVQCSCGKVQESQASNIRRKSRGCISCRARRHGFSYSPLYNTWYNMISRCHNPNDKGYKDYGGRQPAITVCPRWRSPVDGLANFMADMEPSYEPGLTIERKNNNEGYSPDNCCWASKKAQSINRRAHIHNSTYENLLAENEKLQQENTTLRELLQINGIKEASE